jgi:hypothetical protein
MRERRLQRLEEEVTGDADPPRHLLPFEGRWIKVYWHPDDIERGRAFGLDVDALDRVEWDDGRRFPFLGFGEADPLPAIPGSHLDHLQRIIDGREANVGSDEKKAAIDAVVWGQKNETPEE